MKLKTHFSETSNQWDSHKKKFVQLSCVKQILVAFLGSHFLTNFSYFRHFERKIDNQPKSIRKPKGKSIEKKNSNFFFNFFLKTNIEIMFSRNGLTYINFPRAMWCVAILILAHSAAWRNLVDPYWLIMEFMHDFPKEC